MGKRLDLQAKLVTLLDAPNVYFQPKANVQLVYPCIIYSKDYVKPIFADNIPYSNLQRYQITVIYLDPDSDIPSKVGLLPMCKFSRSFVSDNLYHDVYSLYF